MQVQSKIADENLALISAKLYENSATCENGVPVIVSAPEYLGDNKVNSVNIVIEKDDVFFQSSLKYSVDHNGEGGVLFCSNAALLEHTKMVLLYGYDHCQGFVHSFHFNNFKGVIKGEAVIAETKNSQKCGNN